MNHTSTVFFWNKASEVITRNCTDAELSEYVRKLPDYHSHTAPRRHNDFPQELKSIFVPLKHK